MTSASIVSTDRFGIFGGRYVPETLIPAIDELDRAEEVKSEKQRASLIDNR